MRSQDRSVTKCVLCEDNGGGAGAGAGEHLASSSSSMSLSSTTRPPLLQPSVPSLAAGSDLESGTNSSSKVPTQGGKFARIITPEPPAAMVAEDAPPPSPLPLPTLPLTPPSPLPLPTLPLTPPSSMAMNGGAVETTSRTSSRSDQAVKKLGDALLKGYVMMNDLCATPNCRVYLHHYCVLRVGVRARVG